MTHASMQGGRSLRSIRAGRRGLWNIWIIRVLLAAAVLMPSSGFSEPAASDDALHIDTAGRVGIGNQTPRTTLDVSGTISGIGMVPPGGIVMFSGDVSQTFDADGKGLAGTRYEGWQLCNGNNNAPDLRNRFVVAAGGKYKRGDNGGKDMIALSVDHMPAHKHSGRTGGTGKHEHWIEGTDANGLAWRQRRIPGTTTVDMGWGGGKNSDPNKMHWRGMVNTNTTGNHSHPFTTGATGKSQPHENRPPFYALAFIMRLPIAE